MNDDKNLCGLHGIDPREAEGRKPTKPKGILELLHDDLK